MATNIAPEPLFLHGRIVMTPGVRDLVQQKRLDILEYLHRHLRGDWGDLSEDDRQSNSTALREGDRLFSSYKVQIDLQLWIITESDRSVTTLLLPEEY